jgi:hypothetical protein
MNVLKPVSIVILSIVLLSILNAAFASSSLFISNFISCLQLFLLGGIFLWLIIFLAVKILKRKSISFLKFAIIYLTILTALEIGATYLLKHADIVSKDSKRFLTEYYMAFERRIPERTAECGRFDPSLIYIYQPNARCLQQNIEFKDSIYINKAGLRDDDNSLISPDVICLGDSYTMGWGVEQQQSFPQIIEKKTGLKVLNAGISSYGTARETLLLNRLDTSNLKLLIIQYSYNDIAENNAYIKNNYVLPVPPKKQYDSLVNLHRWSIVYFPFKRCLTLLKIAGKDFFKQLRNRDYLSGQWKQYYDTAYVKPAAQSFLDILYKSRINFKKTKVLVVDINRYPLFDHHFKETALKILQDGYNMEFKQSIEFIPTEFLNNQKSFYPLDNHLTAHGHQLLADEIIGRISKRSGTN